MNRVIRQVLAEKYSRKKKCHSFPNGIFRHDLINAAQRKICGKILYLKYAFAFGIWCTREDCHTAPSANSLQKCYREIQNCGTVGPTRISWRAGLSDAVGAKIKGAIRRHHAKCLRAPSTKLMIPFSKIVLHEILERFRYRTRFLQQLLSKIYHRRLKYAEYICDELRSYSSYLKNILFSTGFVYCTNADAKMYNAGVRG